MKATIKSALPPNCCAVCELPSVSTINFGRRSCKACAAFFRRTVAFNNKYKCTGSYCCTVHYEKRMICKKCRYDKCISVDMNPDLVRSKVAEIKKIQTEPKDPEAGPSQVLPTETLDDTIEFYVTLESQLNDRRRLLYNSANVDDIFGKVCECPFDRQCIVEFDFKINLDYRPNIIMMVDYARGYPHFDKLLPEEQGLFYRYCMAVDGTLNCAWYSIRINGVDQFSISQYSYYLNMNPLPPPLEEYEFKDDLVTHHERSAYSIVRQSRISHWFEILKPMERLKLSFTEFALFKAIVCWNVCVPRFSPKSRSYCQIEKTRLIKALMKVCSSPDSDGCERLGEILLFMSPVNEELQRILNELVMHATFQPQDEVDPMVLDVLDYKKW